MGYAQPGTNPLELLELAREAERLGYESAWAAEAWGVDAITPLAAMLTQARAGRIYDGPDEVHRQVVAKRILKAFANGEGWQFS